MSNFMDNLDQRLNNSLFEPLHYFPENEQCEVACGKMLHHKACRHTDEGKNSEFACESGIERKDGEAAEQCKGGIFERYEQVFMRKDDSDGTKEVIEHTESDSEQDGEQIYLCFGFEGKVHFSHISAAFTEAASRRSQAFSFCPFRRR